MSAELKYPDYSGRFVRIKYQAVTTALLLYLVSKYGLKKIKLFPIFEFNQEPSATAVFCVLWLFVAFNIYSFIQRYRFEKPMFPHSLITLEVSLDSLKKRIFDQRDKFENLLTEVNKYSELSRAHPALAFNKIQSDHFSSQFFDLQSELLPVLRNEMSTLDLVAPELDASYYGGAFNNFFRLKHTVTLLTKDMEIVQSLAIKLSSRKRDEDLDVWPDILTSQNILMGAFQNSEKYYTELKAEIPKKQKLENSLSNFLSFNIPFGVCLGLFSGATINFLSSNLPIFLDFIK